MSDINEAFPSRFVKAADLKGRRIIVTLDRVDYELLNRERKPILYFRGKEKGLVLNKTNATRLIELLGSALTEDWQGRRVVLYAEQVSYQGKTVPAVRITGVNQPEPPYAAKPEWEQPAPDTFRPRQAAPPAEVESEDDSFGNSSADGDDETPF